MKINKKRPGITYLFKKLSLVYYNGVRSYLMEVTLLRDVINCHAKETVCHAFLNNNCNILQIFLATVKMQKMMSFAGTLRLIFPVGQRVFFRPASKVKNQNEGGGGAV